MVQTLYYLLKTGRPRQWIKNFAVFAALIFSGFFFYDFPLYIWRVTLTFGIFCLLSSSVYIINDIVDRESDRQHPFKKKRPIASGKLPVSIAKGAAALGIATTVLLSFLLSPFLALLAMAYFVLQFSYSFYLKHIAILDVLTIAAGFMIRIYAGAVVVNLHMSVWFLLTVISASLFIAVAKRQSERTLLTGQQGEMKTFSTRKSLEKYSTRLLDIYTGMFANATWLTYALFAFQHQIEIDRAAFPSLLAVLPRAFTAEKWLMLTVPLVIYIVMRYLQLVYEDNQGESPERVILRDKPLLGAAVIYGIVVMIVIYLL
ncbi:decaprenyl-phosphate phosphoribosyltransferase [Candidatus Woesebacteria bacterium]|nr:decaprenyl-phosphate phosphoribosyltransferase [Candidatus Woesebacteria bacterium]MCD8507524.1 decaprenyl-phosphate phosphoribosyltransferase [Candidatus Woesebacteria bacterium]MCD8527363.1 decaprenyl-phosphate phosphoribosyltransferase [Candidatus Woesebacteria bacterium]MCD8546110.1 decaprenyl-phosphate phosphoribosyltransferase [Candidatus Woesebacteria bacterium]